MNDVTPHFIEWDYTSNVATEYERLGECNGCGDCCMALIRFYVTNVKKGQDSEWQLAADGGLTTTGQGVWVEVQIGDQRRFFQMLEVPPETSRCKNLLDDNRCAIHATKPLLHKAWPMAPSQLKSFARCSYSFREIARRPIKADPESQRQSLSEANA